MPTLTIFTPAYNRAHTLGRTYDSLCRQTDKDFLWLIVDDGSTDGTGQLVSGWISEAVIPIRYVYQDNQGMHGAHNTAYRNIDTELNVCIDSDDWMPDDAVEKIIGFWRNQGSDKYAGMIGLDAFADGTIVGKPFDRTLKHTKLRDYYEKYSGRGDKKIVYRTEVVRNYPDYPVFEGEKYFGLAYKYYLIDKDYDLLTFNDVWAIVEYQQDGSSMGMWKQYWNNPKGFAYLRTFDMIETSSLKRKLMDNVHYVSHSIRSRNRSFLSDSPCKMMTILSLLPGICLYLLNRYKVQRGSLFSKN